MELKRLDEIYKSTPDPQSKEREERFPGYCSMWCTFKQSHFQLGFRDCVVMVHSPQGCVGNTRTFMTTYICQFYGQPFILSPSTDMNMSDVVLGAEDKLRECLLEVDKLYKPKMIFLMVTCCVGVMQQDVEGIVEEMKPQLKAGVMVIRSEGFTHYCHGRTHTMIPARLSELCLPPKKKEPLTINILGISKEVHSRGSFATDSQELERLVNRIGVKVKSVLLQGAYLEDLQTAPEAEFNTFDCPQWGYPLAETMKKKFGVPHGERFNPCGPTETSLWLMEVAGFFGLEKKAKGVIREEYAQIKDVWEEAKRMMEGKIVLIDGGDPMSAVGRGIAWARMCVDMGMEPILFNLPPIEIKGSFRHVEGTLKQGFNPLVVYSDYAYNRRLIPMEVIKGLRLDMKKIGLYIGDVYPSAYARWEEPIFDASNVPRVITTVHCSRQRGGKPGRRTGFLGALGFAEDVINAVALTQKKVYPTLQARLAGLRG